MTFRRLSLPVALSIALLGVALSACGPGEPTEASAPPPDTTAATPPPVNVTVRQVASMPLTERIELSGTLAPWVEVDVSTELGGRVDLLGFDKGDAVQEGQLLARVGTDMLEAALAETRAALQGAEATYERARQLVERQAVPEQELIEATAQFEIRKAQVAQAELRVERSLVKAPISGVALLRDVEVGEVLAPGELITTIHRVNRLKAEIGIPESDIAVIETGTRATLRFDAYPDRMFEGRVHFIAPGTRGNSRTFPAEIEVANPVGELRPGMVARVSLVKRVFEDAVVVSRDALHERDAGMVAVVLDGDVARVRNLSLGPVEGDRVLVEEGLAAGEWLIVSGQRGLVDGQPVQVVERLE